MALVFSFLVLKNERTKTKMTKLILTTQNKSFVTKYEKSLFFFGPSLDIIPIPVYR